MSTLLTVLIVFVGLLGLIFGLGCAVARARRDHEAAGLRKEAVDLLARATALEAAAGSSGAAS
jgi:hypothetical protein